MRKYIPIDTTLTIHVPTPCKNNCSFCINKYYYKNIEHDWSKIYYNISLVLGMYGKYIQNIVISGGEPLENIDDLIYLCIYIKHHIDKNIYINTQFPADKYNEFIDRLDTFIACTDGISISRHNEFKTKSITKEQILRLASLMSVRLNCIFNEQTDVDNIIKEYKNITVNFRRDFRYITKDNLHIIEPELISKLGDCYIVDRNRCNICDTKRIILKDNYKADFYIHSGIENTCVHIADDYYELHDIVIAPDGHAYDDWDLQRRIV